MKIKSLFAQAVFITTAVIALSGCEEKPKTAGEKLDSFIESTKEAAKDASDKAKDMAEDVSDKAKDMAEDASEKAKEMSKDACEKANSSLDTEMDC